ncbi:MAG: hypothetical protein P4L83_22985 [Nevskia sp.]|nr:hypothetical protein [Nevskia sp.]
MKPGSNRTRVPARPGVRMRLSAAIGLRLLPIIALSSACGTAVAGDGFEGIACGTDIAKAMLGRHLTNEPIDATQARHKDLKLKNLGSDELEWGYDEGWGICGDKYFVLVDRHDTVKDVLKLPAKSEGLQFQAVCKGPQGEQDLVGILQDQPGAANLAAKAAWKIDDAKKKFVAVAVDGLACPRGGILGDD